MAPEATTTASKQADATRAEILMHAHELFSHYGYLKTNIGDIAQRCCMSPGNLYRYYRNKQAIGLAAVAQYFRMLETAMDTALMIPEGNAEQRICKMIETGVEHLAAELERNPKIVELAEFLCNDEEGLKVLSEHIAWKRVRLAQEIQRGIDAGDLAPCDPMATASTILNALKSFWQPMTLAHWREPDTILPELHDILTLMFRGLRG